MDIYLVEDDKIYSDFIRKSLSQNSDYKVTAFSNAEDGLNAIEAKLPEVLIIDYKLPGMTGINLYETIKPKITDAHKVIMLSAIDDGNMVLNFIQKGVRDYVIKDENVIDALEAVIEGKEDYFFQ
ncbi:MAG: response regulator [Bacteroidetes bacterium]|nr:response regulator [Bacteroidota bacterium]